MWFFPLSGKPAFAQQSLYELEKAARERVGQDTARRRELERRAVRVATMTPKIRGQSLVCDNGAWYRQKVTGDYEIDFWSQVIIDEFYSASNETELVQRTPFFRFESRRTGQEWEFTWGTTTSPRRLYIFPLLPAAASEPNFPFSLIKSDLFYTEEQVLRETASAVSSSFTIKTPEPINYLESHSFQQKGFSQPFRLLNQIHGVKSQKVRVFYSVSWRGSSPELGFAVRSYAPGVGIQMSLRPNPAGEETYKTTSPSYDARNIMQNLTGNIWNTVCIDGGMQHRRLFVLGSLSENPFGERKVTNSLIALELIDIPVNR